MNKLQYELYLKIDKKKVEGAIVRTFIIIIIFQNKHGATRKIEIGQF